MPGHIEKIRKGYYRVVAEGPKDPVTGKRKRVVRRFRGREADALDLLARLVTELEQGTYVEPSKLTLGEWVQTWLDDYKSMSVRQTTIDLYRWTLKKHIAPALGSIPVQELRGDHLQKHYKKLLKEGKSSRLVHLIHQIVHGALEQARKNGLVKQNVAEATELPPLTYRRRRAITEDEQNKFIEACYGHRYGAAIVLLLGTGLRKGECLGLRWQDVDLESGVIEINQGLVRTSKGLKPQDPKTEKGRRTIPLPAFVVEVLKAHRDRMQYEENYRLDGYVFCTRNGTPVIPRNFDRTFHLLRKKAGIEYVTPHGLRHTFATRLLELDEKMKVVQELLGHSRIGVTADIYSHVTEKLKRRAADKLNQIFKPGTSWAPKSPPEE